MKTKHKKKYTTKKKKFSDTFLTIGNFNYKMSDNELDFLNNYEIEDSDIEFNEKFNLKIEYLKFKKNQEIKGYNNIYVSFEIYLDLYKLLKKCNSSIDIYIDNIKDIISIMALKQLNIYIDKEILIKEENDIIEFRNVCNTDKYITFKVKENYWLCLVYSDKTENINIRAFEKHESKDFLKNIFSYGYFPTEPTIFDYYRKVTGQYISAGKSLFYNKNL